MTWCSFLYILLHYTREVWLFLSMGTCCKMSKLNRKIYITTLNIIVRSVFFHSFIVFFFPSHPILVPLCVIMLQFMFRFLRHCCPLIVYHLSWPHSYFLFFMQIRIIENRYNERQAIYTSPNWIDSTLRLFFLESNYYFLLSLFSSLIRSRRKNIYNFSWYNEPGVRCTFLQRILHLLYFFGSLVLE